MSPPDWVQSLDALMSRRLGLTVFETELGRRAVAWVEAASSDEREPAEVVASLELSGGSDLWQAFVDAVSIPHSYFFRDAEQLLHMVDVLADVAADLERPVRVWVAACAHGEEAWSLAMLCRKRGIAVEILATDMRASSVERARVGRYQEGVLRRIPTPFLPLFDRDGNELVVGEELRSVVRFEVANLLQRRSERFDLITCRNALIYLTRTARERVGQLLGSALHPHGTLWIGASESLRGVPGLALHHHDQRLVYRPAATRMPRLAALPQQTLARLPTQAVEQLRHAPAARFPPPTPAPPLEPMEPEEVVDRDGRHGVDALAAFEEGVRLRREGRHGEAAGALRRALYLAPDLWPASFLLAGTAARLGRMTTRRVELRRTVRLLSADEEQVQRYAYLLDDVDPDDVLRISLAGV